MRIGKARAGPVVALIVLAAMAALLPVAHARRDAGALPEIRASELPPEAREVLARVRRGGPFAYDRDGVAFGNREHILPSRPHGYYHEYTVPTPGQHTRGARRIVCGGPHAAPDACFYTADHYRSFGRITE
jgi:ribonuclease T1